MSAKFDPQVRMIPISQINILNPRERGKKKFAQIVSNISHIGLKKPITVCQISGRNGDARYDLVCGQGRLEAYIALGQTEIPAIVVEGTKEDLLLMSLAENVARRQHSSVELVREISSLKERGYSHTEIARKTDLATSYVKGILQLLSKGEERLLQAVEKGQLPLYIAITIATSDGHGRAGGRPGRPGGLRVFSENPGNLARFKDARKTTDSRNGIFEPTTRRRKS